MIVHCTVSLVGNCHTVSMTGLFGRKSYYGTLATRYLGLRDRVHMTFIWPHDVPSDTECHRLSYANSRGNATASTDHKYS